MHPLFKGQVLRSGQGHTGGGNALHRRVVGQVGEEHRAVDGAGALKLADKELRLLKGDADGGKDHREVGFPIQHFGLAGDLSGQRGVGQAGPAENWQLLAPDQGVQSVDGGDARLDELVGVVPAGRVHGQAVDIPVLVSQDGRSAVDGPAHAVKDPAQHVLRHPQLEGVPQKADLGLRQIDAHRALKQLHHGGITVDLQHLAAADGTVRQLDLPQLVIGDALHMVHHHQGAGDLLDRLIFPNHSASSPFSATAEICSSIWRTSWA